MMLKENKVRKKRSSDVELRFTAEELDLISHKRSFVPMRYLKSFGMTLLAATALSTVTFKSVEASSDFVVGMVVGMAIFGSPSDQQHMRASGLASIPLRCLMATSETDYKTCRYISMRSELQTAGFGTQLDRSLCGSIWLQWRSSHYKLRNDIGNVPDRGCDIDFHLNLEIKALRQLNEQLEARFNNN